MKHILALVLLVASMGIAPGCGSNSNDLTPQQACNDVIGAFCDWTNRCAGAAGLTALGNYTSTADCTSQMQANTCSGTSGNCASGKTFHSDKAQQCIDAFKLFSCTPTTAQPDVCNQVCQSESGSGTAKAVPEFRQFLLQQSVGSLRGAVRRWYGDKASRQRRSCVSQQCWG
jgi:hypothetical protein